MSNILDFCKAITACANITDKRIINSLAENISAYYDSYLDDEASNFGESGYFFATPNSYDDIEVFVWDYLKEYR